LSKNKRKAARCFALDYTANLIDETIAKRSNVPSSEFLRIEKVLTRANRALISLKIEQKERGTLIADWIVVSEGEAVRLARQRVRDVPADSDVLDEELVGKAQSAVLQILKGYSSAKFASLVRLTVPNQKGIATDVVCGKVDVKNRKGNFIGLRPFVYFVGYGTAYYDSGGSDVDREIVKNFCTD
jgi:hypothetical protein